MKAVLIPAVVGFVICGVASLVKFLVADVAGVALTGGLDIFFKIFGVLLFCLFPCFIGFLFFRILSKAYLVRTITSPAAMLP